MGHQGNTKQALHHARTLSLLSPLRGAASGLVLTHEFMPASGQFQIDQKGLSAARGHGTHRAADISCSITGDRRPVL